METDSQPSPADVALKVLNEALEMDKAAITCLLHNSVPCSTSFIKHPTILVHNNQRATMMSAIGIINGVVEAMTGRRIVGVYDRSGTTPVFLGMDFVKPKVEEGNK